MKIGVDISILSDQSAGISRFLINTMDSLQKMDAENEYFLFEKTSTNYKVFNCNWKKVVVPSILPGTLWLQFKIPNICCKLAIEIFWAPEQICPLFGMQNIKIVTTIYDLVFAHYPETVNWPRIWIMKLMIPLSIRKSERIVTISEFIKKDIIKNLGLDKNKVDVIYCGHPGWKTPEGYARKNRKNHLLFVGSFEPRKNLLNIFKALELLNIKNIKIDLNIVGPQGWKNRKLWRYVQRSPIKEQLHFLGYLSDEQLNKEYLSCKAFLYPSLYEGFGLPVLEAISLDCTVITSKNTVMEEVAGNSVIYCDPNDISSLSSKIEEMFLKNGVIPDCDNVRESLLTKFTWENTAEKLLSNFTSLKG